MSILNLLPNLFSRRWASTLFLALLAVMVAACSGSTATPVPATAAPTVPATAPPPSPTPIPPTAVPPSPTPIPPTATPRPTSPPATTAPVATPTVVSRSPLAESAFGYLTDLVEELGPRESATQQELAGAEYLATQLEGFGYSVELQPFAIKTLSAELSGLTIDAQEFQTPDVIPLVSSPEGDASGSLVAIGLAREGDLPEEGLVGKIALAQRGLITFQEKVTRAAEAGALAVVIYNNIPGNFQGVLTRPTAIPALAISQRDGQRIEEMLDAGSVTASVSVKTITQTSHNVVATKPGLGTGSENKTVVLGGHYDTVPNVSGANDNSSGTAVVLALAQELAQESLPFAVRFIGFGSEELGLRGSQHYVASLSEDEKDGIIAMFNFDALGSGRQAGVLGDVELTNLAMAQASEIGIGVRIGGGLQGGGSDHQTFSLAGIPALMFFAPDFSRIHTAADTLEFINPGLLGDAAELALAMLRSPDFLKVLD